MRMNARCIASALGLALVAAPVAIAGTATTGKPNKVQSAEGSSDTYNGANVDKSDPNGPSIQKTRFTVTVGPCMDVPVSAVSDKKKTVRTLQITGTYEFKGRSYRFRSPLIEIPCEKNAIKSFNKKLRIGGAAYCNSTTVGGQATTPEPGIVPEPFAEFWVLADLVIDLSTSSVLIPGEASAGRFVPERDGQGNPIPGAWKAVGEPVLTKRQKDQRGR